MILHLSPRQKYYHVVFYDHGGYQRFWWLDRVSKRPTGARGCINDSAEISHGIILSYILKQFSFYPPPPLRDGDVQSILIQLWLNSHHFSCSIDVNFGEVFHQFSSRMFQFSSDAIEFIPIKFNICHEKNV